MMEQLRRPANWPVVAGCAAVAAALGFGLAHWMATKPVPAAALVSVPALQAENNLIEVKIHAEYLAAAKIAVEAVASGEIGRAHV